MEKINGYYTPEFVFNRIQEHWKNWANKVGAKRFVIGISGGKDSTVVAYLASKIFGPENVIGIMLPNGVQKDISDSKQVIELTGIQQYQLNISGAYNSIIQEMIGNGITVKANTQINLPCRLRMSMLYAVAQSLDAFVINTSNLSEDYVGYATIWGDTCGDYAPIQNLTVTEIILLGEWLGIPYNLIHKVPSDGLQDSNDEERLGIKYSEIDEYIRNNNVTIDVKEKIDTLFEKNYFKLAEIKLPKPIFES